MIAEYWIWKDLDGNCRNLMKLLLQYLPSEAEEASVRAAEVPAKIRREHLQNTNLEPYRHITLLFVITIIISTYIFQTHTCSYNIQFPAWCYKYILILWHVDPLQCGDWEISDSTAVVARQRPANNRETVFSARSAKQRLNSNRGTVFCAIYFQWSFIGPD
jgi:hypothetical protein